jgi:hypothetical protein
VTKAKATLYFYTEYIRNFSVTTFFVPPPHPHSRRTLQRRVALIGWQKRLLLEGRGRASRYRVPAIVDKPLPEGRQQPASKTVDLLVTSGGQEIRKVVRAPIHEQLPVGYNRSFLDSYRPNETSYLSTAVRNRLEQVASVQGGERPAGTYARKILDRLLIDLSWNSGRREGPIGHDVSYG